MKNNFKEGDRIIGRNSLRKGTIILSNSSYATVRWDDKNEATKVYIHNIKKLQGVKNEK